jgi:hypothetical protein
MVASSRGAALTLAGLFVHIVITTASATGAVGRFKKRGRGEKRGRAYQKRFRETTTATATIPPSLARKYGGSRARPVRTTVVADE